MTDKPRSKLSKFIGSTVFMPLVIISGTFLGLSCFACLMKMISARNQANGTAASTTGEEVAMTPQTTTTAAVLPPQSAGGAMTCLDEYYLKIMKSYTISTFLEENFGTLEPQEQGTSCTICLEEYSPQDTIRCIILCQHYFHANCIDQWFEKNSSCPVCRTSIFDVKL
ncbi:hypothetical protein Pfo_001083 [Paulownia fortunei]|nr:hypothetical protein Pfo_001083 [Paulownia fortunei]